MQTTIGGKFTEEKKKEEKKPIKIYLSGPGLFTGTSFILT